MFDIGFSELLLIAVVALVVIGPERLPKVARTAGLLFGRLQRYVASMRTELERELQLDELKRAAEEARTSIEDVGHTLQESGQQVQQQLESARHMTDATDTTATSTTATSTTATSTTAIHPDILLAGATQTDSAHVDALMGPMASDPPLPLEMLSHEAVPVVISEAHPIQGELPLDTPKSLH